MTTAVFWDIDGTLLTTLRAGIHAFEAAVHEVIGAAVDLTTYPTAGLTDLEIAHRLARDFGGREDQVPLLLARYEANLPGALGRKEGHAFPEVRPILDHLRTRPDVANVLLTGNTRAGARAKLERVGLGAYFDGGGFSNPHRTRADVANMALDHARGLLGRDVPPDRRFVIGDTPEDIGCAKSIDARCLAVATGPYRASELVNHGAWAVVERLPPPSEFARRLGL